jgi:pilus assembly protein CpaF
MSLYKRLNEGAGEQPAGSTGAGGRTAAFHEIRHRVHASLIDELGPILYDKRMSDEELRARVHSALQNALAQERTPLSASDKAQLIQDVSDDILGYGPIELCPVRCSTLGP